MERGPGPMAQGPSGREWWNWTLGHAEAKEKLKDVHGPWRQTIVSGEPVNTLLCYFALFVWN